MDFQKQGNFECQLATLAMLSGQPLELVREYALLLAKERGFETQSWKKIHKAGLFWDVIFLLAGDLGLSKWLESFVRSGSKAIHKPGTEASTQRRGCPKLGELKGRGQLTFRCGNYYHAVAFEDGVIYDPAHSGPESVKEWMKTMGRKWLTFWIIRA